jgi:peptidoglycan/xylan/chitin deacetylase (PgdA/CDA1 family)
MPATEKKLYLSFDDGPHPEITSFVLDELKKYGAKATFFCIGNNVAKYPVIFERIKQEGHAIGNHTYDHLNCWTTPAQVYLENIEAANLLVRSNLFRPPYGKTTLKMLKLLTLLEYQPKTIMWSVLSGDFDTKISPERCYNNIKRHSDPGSIIVLHDSEKAYKRMSYALPKILQYFSEKGYQFEKIEY